MELNYQADFEQLLRAFAHIQTFKSKLQQRFVLDKSAVFFGLPKAEFRALFELYLVEHAAEGAGNNG